MRKVYELLRGIVNGMMLHVLYILYVMGLAGTV
jgi:hypothetical protein